MNYKLLLDISDVKKYDTIIIGGGTAGSIAGISAAREGLKTLVIEALSAPGGTQTFSLVTPLMEPKVPGRENVSSAIGEEVRLELVRRGGCDWMWFDPEMLKTVLEEKLTEAGAELLYMTEVIHTIVENSAIKAVIIHSGNKFAAVEADCFIDCTGDGDIAITAGCEYESGDLHGINQSASLRFEMSGIDLGKVSTYLKGTDQKLWLEYPKLQLWSMGNECSKDFKKRAEDYMKNGLMNELDISHLQLFSIPGRPDTISFNCPELGGGSDITDARSLSQKLIYGRQAIMRIAHFVKSEIPGFENAYISSVAALPGIRESNRIKTEYWCTCDDIVSYRKFDDAILRSNYEIDVHGASAAAAESTDFNKSLPENEHFFEMPYRSIVPKGISNLLVCGRCAGFDFYAQSALRVQFCCQAMGEAAGIAAAMAIKNNLPFKDINGIKVREAMRSRGAML